MWLVLFAMQQVAFVGEGSAALLASYKRFEPHVENAEPPSVISPHVATNAVDTIQHHAGSRDLITQHIIIECINRG